MFYSDFKLYTDFKLPKRRITDHVLSTRMLHRFWTACSARCHNQSSRHAMGRRPGQRSVTSFIAARHFAAAAAAVGFQDNRRVIINLRPAGNAASELMIEHECIVDSLSVDCHFHRVMKREVDWMTMKYSSSITSSSSTTKTTFPPPLLLLFLLLQVTWLASTRSEAQAHVCLLLHGAPWWVLFSSSSVVSCALSVLCVYSKFGHHSNPLGYLCAKFRLFRGLHCWASPWRKIAYSISQSLTHP